MRILDAHAALRNYRKGRPYSSWCRHGEGYDARPAPGHGGDRVYSDFLDLQWEPKLRLPPESKFFAAGSCFARNVEQALINAGKIVLSRDARVPHDALHRYNTFSILRDFELALNPEIPRNDAMIEAKPGKWIDYTGHQSAATESDLRKDRNLCIDLHRHVLQSDVLVITLGLVEAWFDLQANTYLNIAPNDLLLREPDRFELRVTSFVDNLSALESFWSAVKAQASGDLKIVVTVSPVPFTATFSGQDVVVANSYSKCVLRAVAQEFCDGHDDAMYFPSYELVTLSRPEVVWRPDMRHVQPDFVKGIMEFFISRCVG